MASGIIDRYGNPHWSEIFGSEPRAIDIVEAAQQDDITVAAWLERAYGTLAAENPGAGYDEAEAPHFDALAEQIEREAEQQVEHQGEDTLDRKLTILVTEDQRRRYHIAAATAGVTLSEVVRDYLDEWAGKVLK